MASRKTVLIVDDDRDVRFVLGAILNYDGYRVVEAADGPSGITLAEEHRPDVVIMDLRMPGMSGLDAARALRKREETSQIPVVALTADDLESWEELGRDVFHSFLRKPIEPKQLNEHVRAIIGAP